MPTEFTRYVRHRLAPRADVEDVVQEVFLALLWRYWERRSAREMATAAGETEKGIERLLARAQRPWRVR